jgi:predicted branched-subunit amino acid permease
LLKISQKNLIFRGILDAIKVPGFALGATMVGFATIAKEAGFDLLMVVSTTALVWGMPGQVAFATLYASGASLFFIFIAVFLANMRMMLMVISGFGMLNVNFHRLVLWKRLVLMQFMAITSWAQIGYVKDKYSPKTIIYYYTGFSSTIFVFGISGTLLGFHINNFVDDSILRIIIFITPLYILLLVINSKQLINKIAVLIGGFLSPILFPFIGNFTILIAGFIGGTLAVIIFKGKRFYGL